MSNNSSCLYYNDSEFIEVAALRAGSGIFSALCCLAVIIVIVKLKRYSLPSQRFVLYLAIAATFHSVSYAFARVNYYTPRYIYDDYCYFGGFFNIYSSWVEVLALFCLTFNLFYNGVMIRIPPLSPTLLLVSTTILPGTSMMTTAILEGSSISTLAGLKFLPCSASLSICFTMV